MKIILSLIFSLCTAFTAVAQRDAIDEISKAAQSINTIQCDFTQTKKLQMLSNAMISKGKMWCSQPNRLRWEYTSPYASTFILNNEKILFKNDKRSNTINANRHKRIREMIRIMIPSNLGKSLAEEKDFKASIETNGNQHILTLLPQSKELKQMFTQIILYYNRQQSIVTKVEMHEKNGDSTTIELTSIEKNIPINESVFALKNDTQR